MKEASEIVYEHGGKRYKFRKSLLASDFEIYAEGRKIIDAVRQKKVELNGSETELSIDMGDFSKDEFTRMVSLGMIDENDNPIEKEICSKLPMDISLQAFASFFFIWISLELLPMNSVKLPNNVQNYLKKLQTTKTN